MRFSLLSFIVFSLLYFSMADPKEEWKNQRKANQQKCQENTKIDASIVKDIKNNGPQDKPDKIVKDFFFCLALYNEFIDKQGNLQLDTIKNHLKALGVTDEMIKEVTEICVIRKKVEDTSLLAVAYYQCYARYVPRDVLVI